ncbi:putative glycolipid permease LtaA [compost metagenome]
MGLVPVGKLVDRYGTKWFLHTGFLLATLAIGLFSVMRNVPTVWAMVVLIGISYSCILPTWDTMISHHLPKGEKGTVWGLFLTIQGSGMVFGPIVSGKMWDTLGPTAPFLASAASMGLLFVIHIVLSRQKPDAQIN